MRVPYRSTVVVIIASSLLAACGSGSPSYSSGSSGVYPAPVTAPALPTGAAFSASSVITPPASAGATSLSLQLPPSTGYSGQATLPVASVPPNLRLTVTYSNQPPTGLSSFAIARKPASAQRSPFDALSTDVVYACFSANYLVQVDGGPQFVFNLPPGFATSNVVYNLAIAQNEAWTDGYGGPGTITAGANSATVSVTGRFGFSIPVNGVVCAALFGRSTSAPTPVPATPAPSTAPSTAPTAAPSASPSTAPSASPSPLGVSAAPVAISGGGIALTVGATDTLTVAAADAPATATTTCGTGSIATLTGSPGATFTLTGTAVGTCSVTLTNAAGKTNTIAVTIAAAPTLGVTAAPVAISAGTIAIGPGSIETLSVATADAPATATTTCTASVATLSGSPGASLTLTGVGAGTCAITLTNAAGRKATLQVVVSAAVLPVQ